MELFGGWSIKVRWLKNWHNGHSLILAYSIGPYFRHHGVMREVKVGKGKDTKFIDFATYANNKKKAIEVLSKKWHTSILEYEKRRRELKDLGWDILYIQTLEIEHHSWLVKKKVMKFLSR